VVIAVIVALPQGFVGLFGRRIWTRSSSRG
jgi:hypothetical protein